MFFRTESGYDILHNKKNEVSYVRVKPRDFVIYLRSFQDYFAASELEGITSPAYTVIHFVDDNQDFYFWKYIFTSLKFVNSLVKVAYEIRNDKSISYSDFKNLKWCLPNRREQK